MDNFKDLRPYQIEDANFLAQFQQCGCFNDPRTGKTPTSLYVFKKQNINKILIVCPASMVSIWASEFERWTGNPCLTLNKTRKKNLETIQNWTHGLAVSYDTLKETRSKEGFFKEIMHLKPEGVILDEAHRIKGRSTAAAKAALNIRTIPHRIALTATPAPNKPHDIWPILNWLYPKEFTSYWNFIGEYMRTVQMGTFRDIRGFKVGKAHQLQTILAGRTTQRKRIEVMPWLPAKDYIQIKLDPTTKQLKYLKELHKYFETEHINTQGVLDRLIRYRQICLDPGILELEGNSPKTDWIVQYLKDYPEKPIIVFSKFRTYLERLNARLQHFNPVLLVGGLQTEQKQTLIQNFQIGKNNLLLIQIDVGKEGITLDRAETIIFTDKFPPAADITQAEDRFIATTPDKADKPHLIIELILKGTYDEEVYNMVKEGKHLTDVLNDYQKFLPKRRRIIIEQSNIQSPIS